MKTLYISLILILLPIAQSFGFYSIPFVQRARISAFAGSSEINIEKSNPNGQVDFMHYMQYNSDFYFGINAYFIITPKLHTDIKTYVNSALETDHFQLKLLYYPTERFAISANYASFPFTMEAPTAYYSPTYYAYVPNESEYLAVNNERYLLGVAVPFESGKITGTLHLRGGLSQLSANNITMWQKKYNSNERRMLDFAIKPSSAFIVNPELDARWEWFRFGEKSKFGLQFQASWSYASHSMRYTQNTFTWTMENSNAYTSTPASHTLMGIDWNIGLFYGF